MAFHSDSTRTSDNGARLVDGLWVQVAALLCSNSHDFTNGNGSHTVIGGPDNEINIITRTYVWQWDVIANYSTVQTVFILLKLRSHAAVLRGILSIKFVSFLVQWVSWFLYSLYIHDNHLWLHWKLNRICSKAILPEASPNSGNNSFATSGYDDFRVAREKLR